MCYTTLVEFQACLVSEPDHCDHPPRPPIPFGTQLVCLVAASDGVWDNWMYGDVSAFFLDPARTAEVMETNSAEGVTEAFMQENARKANANFGSQVRGLVVVVDSPVDKSH